MASGRNLSRRDFLAGAAAVSAAWTAPPARGQAPELDRERLAAIDGLLRQAAALGMFDGLVKIDRGGRVLFDRAYGLADYERRTSFGSRTRFRIASLSKPMTDAALAALAAAGRLRLDDPLARYLPQFPSADRITLEMIARHRSGIPHTNDQPWGDGSVALPHDEILARLARLPLDFEPGAERRYSNGGYAALVRAMEMAAGEPYPEIMRRLVFAPLGMRDSGTILDSRAAIPRLARGYQPGEAIGHRAPARFYAAETRPGGGSLYSSAADVLRFFQAAWRGRLGSSPAHAALFPSDRPRRAADGRAPGYYMDVYNVREADLIVSSTANNYAAEFRWAENIARLALGEAPLFASLPAVDRARRPAPGEPLLGRFRSGRPGFSQDISVEATADGRLLLSDVGPSERRALIPLAGGGYLDPLYYLVARADSRERIRWSALYEGGFENAWVRRG